MKHILPDIEMIHIADLHLNPDNPRIIKDEKYLKLLESIKNFPQMMYLRPIVIDSHNMILGGNQRFEACQELNFSEVPIIRAINLTANQIKQFIIRDNINNGAWNIDKLITDWDAELLESCSFDMDIIQNSDALKIADPEQLTPKKDKDSEDVSVEQVCCPKCGFQWSL